MASPVSLKTVGYVIHFVRNMEKATAFYRDSLGISVKMGSPEWTELETEGLTLALHRTDLAVPRGAAQAELVFNVDDVRGTHAALHRGGVGVGDLKVVWEGGDVLGMSAEFSDPDGNRLSIHGVVPKAQHAG